MQDKCEIMQSTGVQAVCDNTVEYGVQGPCDEKSLAACAYHFKWYLRLNKGNLRYQERAEWL